MELNAVPTTCTAKQITGWSISGLTNADPLAYARSAKKYVQELINKGFMEDFALIFAITTDQQVKSYGLEPFLKKIGFESSFTGEKEEAAQRHKETGTLHMWCTTPKKYKESLQTYLQELTDEINRLDRRRICPERQAMPDLLLKHLRKEGLVQNNAYVDNPISQILIADADALAFFIRSKYGIDVTEVFGKDWTRVSSRQIKEAQQKWKNELVPY